MSVDMNVEGKCHCGEIAFTAQVDPDRVGICHCADCQTLSGSPYRIVAPAEAGRFRLLRGKPTIYIKTADSGGSGPSRSVLAAERRSMPPKRKIRRPIPCASAR